MAIGTGLGGSLSPLALPGTNSFQPVNQISGSVSDVIQVHDAPTYVYAQQVTLAQGIGAHEALLVGQGVLLQDDIGASPYVSPIRAQPASLTQGIGVNDALALQRGIQILEHLGMQAVQLVNQKSQLSASDAIRTHDALQIGIPVSLTGGIGISLTQSAQVAIQVLETLGLHEVLAPAAKFSQSINDAIRLADALGRFFGGDIVEGIGVHETMIGSAQRNAVLDEGIGVLEAVSPRMVLRVTAAEEIGIDDAATLQMIYSGQITDGVEISAAYIAPSGSITTWAMNTRNAAISEYTNYEFNSFARIGNKYIGASSSGLYELVGDTDAGADIIATIKSGFAEWAGSKFAMFQGIYLGVRGTGDFVLKVITGDNSEYIYSVTAQSMKTTKITTGKGLRARYFAFELVSTGQDFDLDTIEFVPIASSRRV